MKDPLKLTTKQKRLVDKYIKLRQELSEADVLLVNGYSFTDREIINEVLFINGENVEEIVPISDGDPDAPECQGLTIPDYDDVVKMDNEFDLMLDYGGSFDWIGGMMKK